MGPPPRMVRAGPADHRRAMRNDPLADRDKRVRKVRLGQKRLAAKRFSHQPSGGTLRGDAGPRQRFESSKAILLSKYRVDVRSTVCSSTETFYGQFGHLSTKKSGQLAPRVTTARSVQIRSPCLREGARHRRRVLFDRAPSAPGFVDDGADGAVIPKVRKERKQAPARCDGVRVPVGAGRSLSCPAPRRSPTR
jgi:hypothetical protein